MKHILSIDGGGIRGILPAAIIANLEKRLIRQGNDSTLRIAGCFDLLAGTSAGGILTALYLTPDPANPLQPRYTASEILDFYCELGPLLFRKSPAYIIRSAGGLLRSRYSEDALYDFARKIIGDAYISEVAKDCLITAYDLGSRKALLFGREATKKYGDMADYKLCDIACATSAAPSYFIPAEIPARDGGKRHLVDGGVYANNPSMCALVEAFKLWPGKPLQEFKMLSVGCGKVVKPYHHNKTRNFGYIHWLNPILDILMSSVAETTDYQARQMFHIAGVPDNYVRIEPPMLNADSRIDNAKPYNIRRLLSASQNFIDHNQILLDSLCEGLLDSNN
ncbi:MAG: patatin [Bacteroidia bacterium]|nr:patatin [Bacteroidia bacterium]